MIVANLFVWAFILVVRETEVIPDLLNASLFDSVEVEAAVEGTRVGFLDSQQLAWLRTT